MSPSELSTRPDEPSESERRLVRYLLGALPEEEQEALEQRYFTEPVLLAELEAAADELIQEYLSGALAGEDRIRFESHFLASPRQQERLRFMQALLTGLARPSRETGTVRTVPWRARSAVWAAAAVLTISTASAVLFRWSPAPASRRGTPPARTAAVSPTPLAGPKPLPDPIVRLLRGARVADVVVPDSAGAVRFEVAVDGRHWSYDARLQDRAGATVWRRETLEPARERASIVFSVPAAILATGAYVLSVEAEALRDLNAPSTGPVLECQLHVRRTR